MHDQESVYVFWTLRVQRICHSLGQYDTNSGETAGAVWKLEQAKKPFGLLEWQQIVVKYWTTTETEWSLSIN